jgi:FTR1 family protein
VSPYFSALTGFRADERVRFIAGVGLGLPATSFPLAVLCGLGAGALVGWFIYKGGNRTSLQVFLVVSTCFLYLVAAGLFSKGVWKLEQNAWVKLAGEGAAEAGSGPGSYDIRKSVWHVNVSRSTRPMAFYVLTVCTAVLLSARKWPRGLGYLQQSVRLAEQRDIRLRHFIQPLLVRGHRRLHLPRLERKQRRRFPNS